MRVTEITTKISGIYKINFPNNKIYIGRAADIKRRIKEHYNKKDDTPCYKALIKYYTNVNNIDFDILYIQSILNLEELKEKEKYYIKLYDARNKTQGYNITEGGEGADYGVNNIASKISEEELNDIINRLKNGESNIEIGKIYNLHPDTIGRINNGTTYYNEHLKYPLRESSIKAEGFKNGNSLNKEKYLEAIKLIKQGISIVEISKKTNISSTTLHKINKGNHFICKEINENYPLFIYGRRTVSLTEQDISNIKKDLLNPYLSTTDIANKYKVSRDTVSDINQGKRYRDKNEEYPIRTFYPKRGSKKPVSTILESEE